MLAEALMPIKRVLSEASKLVVIAGISEAIQFTATNSGSLRR
jgi:hypothetical protein